jgi:hypothetical protein
VSVDQYVYGEVYSKIGDRALFHECHVVLVCIDVLTCTTDAFLQVSFCGLCILDRSVNDLRLQSA